MPLTTLTMKLLLLFIGMCSLGLITGPVLALLTAETALWAGLRIPVPLWDHWLRGTVMYGLQVWATLLAISVLVRLRTRRTPPYLMRSLVVVTFVSMAAMSLLVALVPVLNGLYDRYQATIRNGTMWAPGYSEDRFLAVVHGMEAPEVVAAVGEPIHRFTDARREVWVYSQIGQYSRLAEKGFHQRAIALERGRVVHIYRRYLTSEHTPFD